MPNVKEERKRQERSDFKNVETKILHNNSFDQVLRPRVDRVEDLMKIANDLKSTPTAVVNFLVDVGLECFERSIPKLKEEIKKQVSKKIKVILK